MLLLKDVALTYLHLKVDTILCVTSKCEPSYEPPTYANVPLLNERDIFEARNDPDLE